MPILVLAVPALILSVASDALRELRRRGLLPEKIADRAASMFRRK